VHLSHEKLGVLGLRGYLRVKREVPDVEGHRVGRDVPLDQRHVTRVRHRQHALDRVRQVPPVDEGELRAPHLAPVQRARVGGGGGRILGVDEARVEPAADEGEVGAELLGLLVEVEDGVELEVHTQLRCKTWSEKSYSHDAQEDVSSLRDGHSFWDTTASIAMNVSSLMSIIGHWVNVDHL
jgi:hypothetical protein